MSKYDTLKKEYIKLAKQADTRMERLERYSEEHLYHGVLEYAYARAAKDISARDKKKYKDALPRFNRNIPKGTKALQSRLNSVKKFLDSPTSTKTGITAIYKKRADTVNKLYGTNFKWQDLANYYDSQQAKRNDEKYGSDTLIYAMGVINKKNLTPEDIQNAIDHHKKLTPDSVVDEIIKELHASGQSFETLFNRKPKTKK